VPPSPTASGQEIATLKAAIEACVQVGRAVPPQYSDGSMTKGFDAHNNPISGRVQNNVRYQGEMPARYAFNKCMVGKGMSLRRRSTAPVTPPTPSGAQALPGHQEPDTDS
jgi:hypothetical protein